MTDNFKRFMTFSRSERIAIIAIVSMIVIALVIKYLLIQIPPKGEYFKHDLDSIIARREAAIDSVRVADSIAKAEARAKRKLSQQVKKSTKNYGKNNTKKFSKKQADSANVENPTIVETTIDLNTADTALLQQLYGIGPSFAGRIVEYRDKLGGFVTKEQLFEVYGMDSARYYGFMNRITVDSSYSPKLLRINYDSFKALFRHPYLNYEEVKKIVNYREHKGLITSWRQLSKVVGEGINPKLQYYVDYQ